MIESGRRGLRLTKSLQTRNDWIAYTPDRKGFHADTPSQVRGRAAG
jgi:hypothetical protein